MNPLKSMEKLFIFLMIGLLLIGSFFILNHNEKEKDVQSLETPKYYQGPVPEGYDETHFRLTGETIPEVKE